MSTRLQTEHFIKINIPQIKYLYVHGITNGHAIIYAWDDQLTLTESLINRIKNLDLAAHIRFDIKPYDQLKNDYVILNDNPLPPEVIRGAIYGTQNKLGIETILNSLFSNINLKYLEYERENNMMTFQCKKNLLDIEYDILTRYLKELLPLGSAVKIVKV